MNAIRISENNQRNKIVENCFKNGKSFCIFFLFNPKLKVEFCLFVKDSIVFQTI